MTVLLQGRHKRGVGVSAGARPRASLVEVAYRRLKDEIMNNRLPPGFQILETELAARLEMSRTPVREAVIRLCNEGLMEIRQRRGVRVLPISPEDMQEIYELLAILEPAAAAGLVRAGLSDAQLVTFEQAVDAMATALDDNDRDAWAAADDRFHRLHLDYLLNRRLARTIGQLLDQAHRVRMFTLHLRRLPVCSTADHRQMVAALRSGDAEHVSRLYREHRERAVGELIGILKKHRLRLL